MNKNKHITLTGLVAFFGIVLFAVVLLGCPVKPPEEKKDEGPPHVELQLEDEYINFHSYHGKVKNVGGGVDNVSIVISTEQAPKAFGSIDNSAKLIRSFTEDETRRITISWSDTFKRSDLYNGENKKTGPVNITSDADYGTKNVSWVLRAGTQYYLHIYYSDGTKAFSKDFTTASYPTSATTADALFAGDNTKDIFNFNGLPSPQEHRANNPFAASVSAYGASVVKMQSVGVGASLLNNGIPSVGISINFKDKAVLTSTSGFKITDSLFVAPDVASILKDASANTIELTTQNGLTLSIEKTINIVDR